MNYYNYQASKNFYNRLKELDKIRKLIKEHEKQNNSTYSTLIKSNLILLCAYFETYIEEIVEEFIVKLNELNLKSSSIPESIKKFQAKYIFELIDKKHSKQNNKVELSLLHLMDNWDINDITLDILNNKYKYENSRTGQEEIIGLNPINKFNYGKHGASEVKKIFKNIDIDIQKLNYLEESFNQLILDRNNIIHNGGININITFKDIKSYLTITKQSIKTIDKLVFVEESQIILNNSDIER